MVHLPREMFVTNVPVALEVTQLISYYLTLYRPSRCANVRNVLLESIIPLLWIPTATRLTVLSPWINSEPVSGVAERAAAHHATPGRLTPKYLPQATSLDGVVREVSSEAGLSCSFN